MVWMKRLLSRLSAYLFPMPNWKDRVRKFRAGTVVWPISLYPNTDPMSPWPSEWTVVSMIPKGGGKAQIHFHDTVSAVSGREAKGEDAVRCARCGIHLHVADTNMEHNLDIPACSWCVGAVSQA
jgi:hypothetical protein